jgi:hypothetical protein
MSEERERMTLAEFHERCASLFAELSDMLESFDDETDPAGIADAIVGRYLAYYLDPAVLDKMK